MNQAAASFETIQVLFSQSCITHAHCARYLYTHNLYIHNLYIHNHACPQNHMNSQNKQGALGQSES